MADQSLVLIRGGSVPGISMEVVVPTNHSFCLDAARQMYRFEGAEYIWVRSWSTDDAPKQSSASSSSSSGNPAAALGLVLLLVPLAIIGSIFGDDETPPAAPEAPVVEQVAPAPAQVPTALTVPFPVPSEAAAPRMTTEIPTTLPLFPPEPMPWESEEDLTGNPDFIFTE